jgi:glycosyltransferase involved in cell wall biosynthesis
MRKEFNSWTEYENSQGAKKVIMVSVIMTSYNNGDKLQRAIKSVESQKTTFPVEILIIDDGSKDGSLNVAAVRTYTQAITRA